MPMKKQRIMKKPAMKPTSKPAPKKSMKQKKGY